MTACYTTKFPARSVEVVDPVGRVSSFIALPDGRPSVVRGSITTVPVLLKGKKALSFNGPIPPKRVQIHARPMCNLVEGVLKRVVYNPKGEDWTHPFRPTASFYEDAMARFSEKLLSRATQMTPIPESQYSAVYSGVKRRVYDEAYRSLLVNPLSMKDAEVHWFGKVEKLVKDLPVQRVISTRSPRMHLKTGKFLRRVEKKLYRDVDWVFGSRTVMKGMTAEEVGKEMARKWNRFANPVAFDLDAVKFDRGVSRAALDWTFKFYARHYCGKDFKELLKLWKMRQTNVCKFRCSEGWMKYTSDHGRMSGDVDTGLGNTIIMCGAVYELMIVLGIANYELVNNGDDCIIIMERRDVGKFNRAKIDRFFGALGHEVELSAPIEVLERCTFCQMRCVFDGKGYIMVRDPWKAVRKDMVCEQYMNSKNLRANWIRAVSEGGISLSGGIPVFQAFYQWMGQLAGVNMQRRIDIQLKRIYWSKGMARKSSAIDDRCRVSFWRAFGIPPHRQIAIEEMISQYPVYDLGRQKLGQQVDDIIEARRDYYVDTTDPQHYLLLGSHVKDQTPKGG